MQYTQNQPQSGSIFSERKSDPSLYYPSKMDITYMYSGELVKSVHVEYDPGNGM